MGVFLILLLLGLVQNVFAEPLSGLVVVLDAGHGGKDPGAHAVFGGNEVFESEYVYDVAKRIERDAEYLGVKVFMTTRKTPPANLIRTVPPYQILPRDGSESFSLSKKIAKAGRWGLEQRVDYANEILLEYPRAEIVFLSIHFDAVPYENIYGMRIITPNEHIRLPFLLAEACRKRLRQALPIVISGDRNHGMRNLYILREGYNNISERVLIELGNFNNPGDVWRIRNPQVRDDYAACIIEALKKL